MMKVKHFVCKASTPEKAMEKLENEIQLAIKKSGTIASLSHTLTVSNYDPIKYSFIATALVTW